MYNIIKKYCENENTNGLFLIDMPTGFGKTYSVKQYLSDVCHDKNNKNRKYFFITPLKKNLPVDDLGNISEKVLVIRSNLDMVMKNYTDEIDDLIPDDIKKTDKYEAFQQQLSFLRNTKNKQFKQIYEKTKEDFRINIEPAFRKMLQGKLSVEFGRNKKTKIHAIKTDEEWQWLGKLYPTVFTEEYQIYIMSMDKFMMKNSTIVEP